MTDSLLHHDGKLGLYNLSYVNLCILLKRILTKSQLGLVYLGSIGAMEGLGWNYMYLLIGSQETPTPTINSPCHIFRRVGVLVLGFKLLAEKPTEGRFLIA